MAGVLAAAGFVFTLEAQQPPPGPHPSTAAPHLALVDEYCLSCHDEDKKKGELALDTIAAHDVAQHPDVWEKVVRKLRARQMPPVGQGAAGRGHLRRGDRLPGDVARPRGRRASESWPDGDDPAAHSNRIPERHPRSPRARGRCRVAAARRRVQLWLRQCDGRRSVADAAGPLHLGGGEDQPGGGRTSQPFSGRRHHQDSAGPHAGGAPRGPAGRHARRRGGPLHVSAGRRVRDPDSADARPRRARRGAERAARSRAAARQGARAAVHGEAAAARGRISESTADHERRSAPQDPRSGAGRSARARRGVSEETVAAAGNRASALPGALQFLPASADPAGHLLDLDHRSLCRDRVRATRPAAAGFSCRGRRARREEDALRANRSWRR